MKHTEEVIRLIKKTRPLYLERVILWNGRSYLGYSHIITIGDSLKGVDTISRKESLSLLEKDIKKIEKSLNKHLTIELNTNQFDALISLVYDIGIKAFISDEMLVLINKGCLIEASLRFSRFNKYMKKQVYRLVKTRKTEVELFNKSLEE